MALQIGAGNPANTLGADGDYYLQLDTAGNRYFVGPKANGAWPSTYYSVQGPTGPGLLSGAGAPASSVGAQGQGYVDLQSGTTYSKNASGWSLITSNAFQGPIGPATLANVALTGSTLTAGPQAGLTTATTTTANYVLPIPGTTQPQVFVPPSGALFAGFTYLVPSNSGSNVAFNLYDQTAGSVVYTSSTVATGTINVSDKRSSTIGLVGGNQHVWRVSAGSNVLTTVTPYYILPAYGSIATTSWPTAALSSDVNFSGTSQALRTIGGSTTNGPLQYYLLPKATYLQSATITVTGSASVQLVLQTGSSVVYSVPVTVNASNSPYTTPVYGPGTVPLAASTSYVWYASGSGTGQVYVTPTYAG